MLVRPLEMEVTTFRILGYGLILYAVVELINGIKIARMRSQVEEIEPMVPMEKPTDIEEAEIVEE